MHYVYDRYRDLLDAFIAGGYRVATVHEAASASLEAPFVVVRHDVEWSAERALAVARIERAAGVTSTMYFRIDTHAFDVRVMRELQALRFDIGYHYNVLDRCGGDFKRAEMMFEHEVTKLRELGIRVSSAAPHGDPKAPRLGYMFNSDLLKCTPDLLRRLNLFDIGPFGNRFRLQDTMFSVSDANMRWNRGELSWPFFFRVIKERSIPRMFPLTHVDYWSKSRIRAVSLRAAAFGVRAFRIRS